jgi:hypothetical protein
LSVSSSSIGCEPRPMKWRSQVRISPPPILVWTCQKKKSSIYNFFSSSTIFIILFMLFKLYEIIKLNECIYKYLAGSLDATSSTCWSVRYYIKEKLLGGGGGGGGGGRPARTVLISIF